VTDDIATLKAIKEREEESKKRIELARVKGTQIINDAKERAKRIISEAEEDSKRSYDQYLRKEMETASLEIELIKKKFEEEAAKLRREISKDVVEKMVRAVMENNE
jgi:vacuolar-type H+-ATPase subunit H